jgi:hypothetical protein
LNRSNTCSPAAGVAPHEVGADPVERDRRADRDPRAGVQIGQADRAATAGQAREARQLVDGGGLDHHALALEDQQVGLHHAPLRHFKAGAVPTPAEAENRRVMVRIGPPST